jgi:predicted ATP-grasp superfamily ATP-dependent carboligase
MKILLLEYITGGGLAGSDLPASLAREGAAMAAALAEDLLALPQVTLRIPWDARLPRPAYADRARAALYPVETAEGFAAGWAQALAACDAVWPVAPESGGVLESLCRDVQQAGKLLLNSPAAAVALAASKRATLERLAGQGIPCVPVYALRSEPDDLAWPRVLKPDDGVGCEQIFRLDNPAAWSECLAGLPPGDWLVQPYLAGEACSLSALFGGGEARLLSVNRQRIELAENGAFRLTGCEVNALADVAGEYAALAGRIAAAVPELAGYAGVDFIQTPQGPLVLEINPRLTSSYAGLRRALGLNPAGLVLEWFEHGALPLLPPVLGDCVVVDW